ncbi:MAG: penicillin-binding transpeptidase domain-containing protein [Acidimicrobiales bacterium]
MNDRPLRHVTFILMLCFCVLFAQLNRIQVFEAESLKDDPSNTRTVQRDFKRPRGPIVTSDGVVVARSVMVDGPIGIERQYPEGDHYAHVAGYLSFTVGADGVERSFNDELVGRTPALELSSLAQVLGDAETTGEVVLTLRDDLQRVAKEQLGNRPGSVVALDPRTGEILAMWSAPSFDPNPLASQDGATANAAYAALLEAEGNPLRASAFREIFFPGSTFKVVTASAALADGAATLQDPVFPIVESYTPPLTSRPIANFGGRSCGGDLLELLRASCNSGIAQLATELIGPQVMVRSAQAYGFNVVPPLDIPGAVASNFPADYGKQLDEPTEEIPAGVFENSPALAQASIGQNDVSATPLQMALVAAAIANGGRMQVPHVVAEVRNVQGRAVSTTENTTWQVAVEPDVATQLRLAMVEVVERGTGSVAATPGLVVGGKTGTAQLGTDPARSHAWFICFAGREGQVADLAIAVLVEGQEGASEQTGGRVAGPIAKALIDTYFQES